MFGENFNRMSKSIMVDTVKMGGILLVLVEDEWHYYFSYYMTLVHIK